MADTNVTTEGGKSGALDVPTTDIADLVRPAEGAYFEDENHRPEALYQYGTVDTSDTSGGAHQSVAEVSPVFAEARARNLLAAARALDPEDDGVGAEMVTLPQGAVTVTGTVKTADEGRADIEGALKRLADNPIGLGGPSPSQQEAAEEAEDTSNPDADESTATPNPAPTSATTSESTSSMPPRTARQSAASKKN